MSLGRSIALGQRFANLVALEAHPGGRRAKVLCRCDCGKERAVENYNLNSGKTRSCGCLRGKRLQASGLRIGDKFHRLTVIEEDKSYLQSQILCRCDCGTEKRVHKWSLRGGRTKSCGCWRRENMNGYKHGMSYHPDFNLWMGMVRRCTKPSASGWYKYGGRGIRVCERWSGDQGFKNFIEDMGPRPSKGHSLDRVDVNGNYEPGNVRWATVQQQADNRRTSRPRMVDQVKAAMDRVLASKSESFTKLEVLSILRVLRFNLVGE